MDDPALNRIFVREVIFSLSVSGREMPVRTYKYSCHIQQHRNYRPVMR